MPIGRVPRGYRWPAEWEPHVATWLSWPHNPETWPRALEEAEAAFVAMCRALAGRERVRIGLAAHLEASVRERLERAGVDAAEGIEFYRYPTHDAWVRDHGPIFLIRAAAGDASGPQRILLDFRFDNWGRKYPGWEVDDAVPTQIARATGVQRIALEIVLEGGAIDGDGEGTILTTESCLLHPNRAYVGPHRTHSSMEGVLRDTLAAQRTIWLAGGIAGDDTDGHVDDVARFVRPGLVAAVTSEIPGDPDRSVLEENRRRLLAARDARDRRLEVVELPAPPPLVRRGERLPASYANFYLANGVALVPVFGAQSDERALRTLSQLLPEREIVPIPSAGLVEGLGAIHCATQQEPAPPAP